MKRKSDLDVEGINNIVHLSKNILKVLYIIIIVGVVLGILIFCKQLNLFSFIKGVLKVISPLFIGFAIAWLFYPIHKKFVKKGIPKVASALMVFLMILLIILLVIYIFIPILYKQVNDLVSNLPAIIGSITDFVTVNMDKVHINGIDTLSIKKSLISAGEDYIISITSALPNGIVGFVKSTVSAIGVILISLVIGIYMLIDFENVRKLFHKVLPKNNREDYVKLFRNIETNARRVVNGTLLVALLVFICDSVGFTIVGLDSALLFGLFCGLTDLIPFIGPYIGGGVAVIVGLTQSPIVGIGALIIALIVQLLENYIFQPMVMSKAMQLHPILIIVGLLLFGYFFGIIGMILATPCIAIIKEVIIFINRKRKTNK